MFPFISPVSTIDYQNDRSMSKMKKVDASQSISKMNTESAIRKKNDPRLRKMTQVSTKRNQVKKLVSARKYNSSMRKTDFINGTLNLFLCGHF